MKKVCGLEKIFRLLDKLSEIKIDWKVFKKEYKEQKLMLKPFYKKL